MSETIDERVHRLHQEAPFTDVHAHPSMKTFLFGLDPCVEHPPGPNFSPDKSRTSLPYARAGGVKVMWAAHYVPEQEFVVRLRRCAVIKLLSVTKVVKQLLARLPVGASEWSQFLEMVQSLEDGLTNCSSAAEVAASAADVRRIVDAGKIAIVHTIEGAHVLEKDLVRLDSLPGRFGMMTLSHFCWNGYVDQVDAIPGRWPTSVLKWLCTMCKPGQHGGLTLEGQQLIDELIAHRMLVDITHCSPEARSKIYAHVDRRAPIVASHAALDCHMKAPYNLTETDVREIHATGGAIGVIFSSHWLDADERNGIGAIWRTIRQIHAWTGSWDSILLGTDFDGFTNPPDDLRDYRTIPRLTAHIWQSCTNELGLPETEADDATRKIIGGNAMRLLEQVWS